MLAEKSGKVIVIGAGFSGMAVAHFLLQRGLKVKIIEKTARVGGLLQTDQNQFGLVERAANGFLNSSLLQTVAHDIGVRLVPAQRQSRRRYIWRGRPRRMPLSSIELMALLPFIGKIISTRIMGSHRTWLQPHPGESIRRWGQRQLRTSATCYLLEAAMQGIYAGNPAELSASLILKRLLSPSDQGAHDNKGEQAYRGSVAPAGGMSEWIENWRKHLQASGVEFELTAATDASGVTTFAVHQPVVICTNAPSASVLLQGVSIEAAEILKQIKMVPIVSVTVFLPMTAHGPQGFGCLFPPVEKRLALGVLFNNDIFPNRAQLCRSETWILGGMLNSEAVHGLSDEALIAKLMQERAEVFQCKAEVPLSFQINRWPTAFPHYDLTLEAQLEKLPLTLLAQKNVFLNGNYLGQIGLSRLLESAQKVAEQVVAQGKWN